VAACAVLPRGAPAAAPELQAWLLSLRAAGVRRVYLHIEGLEGSDGRAGSPNPASAAASALVAALQPQVASGLLLLLSAAHPPPRYGVRERGDGLEDEPKAGSPRGRPRRSGRGAAWAGYREVLGRCLTQALLEGACALLHTRAGGAAAGRLVRERDGALALPEAQAGCARARARSRARACARLTRAQRDVLAAVAVCGRWGAATRAPGFRCGMAFARGARARSALSARALAVERAAGPRRARSLWPARGGAGAWGPGVARSLQQVPGHGRATGCARRARARIVG